MATIQEQLQANRGNYQERLREIQEDPRLNDDARREDSQQAYSEASGKHEDLVRDYRRGLEEDYAKRQRSIFAAPEMGDNPALNTMVYRDALDRTSGVSDPTELVRMMDEAALVGDSAMLKACLLRGYNHPIEEQRSALVERYFSHRGDEAKAWDEWMNVAEGLQSINMYGAELTLGVPAPSDPSGKTASFRSAGSGDDIIAGQSAFEAALQGGGADAAQQQAS
jgi:hypothetical protein